MKIVNDSDVVELKKGKIIFLLLLVGCIALLYESTKKTYTSYESKTEAPIQIDIADWNIEINGQNIVEEQKEILLSDIVFENPHTNPSKVSPGSKGVITAVIDPSKTQVAIYYEISYVDHLLDENVILKVTSIELEGEELTQKESNVYSGIITLDEIKQQTKKKLTIHVEWENNEENNELDSEIGLSKESQAHYLTLNFKAMQYRGE